MAPHLRQLSVTVAEARGLLAGDRNGLSDPFVELSARDARGARLPLAGAFSTPVARRTLAPAWHARFSLGAPAFDLRLATSLRFLVYDYDALKFNDVLGAVDVPLAMLEKELLASEDGEAKTLDAWYAVTRVADAMTEDATGELRLVFSTTSSGAAGSSLVLPPPAPIDAAHPPNLLFVTVEAARGLLAMDKDTGSSDPLVKLALLGQKRETRVVAQSLKPHWDETFAFLLPDEQLKQPPALELLVEDEDRGALRNDFLGRALVPVPMVATTDGDDEWVVTVPLLDRKLRSDKPRGALRLRIQRVFDPRARRVVASMDKKSRKGTGAGGGMFMALQQSMRTRMAPDQEEVETDDEDGDKKEDDAEPDTALSKDDDWLMTPYSDAEPVVDDEGEETTTAAVHDDGKKLPFLVVTVHSVEALPSMDAVLFDSASFASASAWGPTCSTGSVGGAVDVYVTACLAGQEDKKDIAARTRVRSVFGPREQLRARFRDRLMVLTEDGNTPLVLKVMDWDPVGEDELVGRVELPDPTSLVGRDPFWINLYGAPTGSNAVSTSTSGKAAAERMNVQPSLGSAFRGRICVSFARAEKPASSFEAKHQTCRIVKPVEARLRRKTAVEASIPAPTRLLWPATGVFKLRAHFIRAEGLSVLSSAPAAALVVSCGLAEIGSSARRISSVSNKTRGAVEWNDVVESDRFALPLDPSAMPDVYVYLGYASDATGRVTEQSTQKERFHVGKQVDPVCFKRLSAKSILVDAGATSKTQWLSLTGDRAIDKVRGRELFPGAALVRLELLPWTNDDELHKSSKKEDGEPTDVWASDVCQLVSERAPYQVRVRVEDVRNLVREDGEAAGKVTVLVQCGEQDGEVEVGGKPGVVCLDLQLPTTLRYAPRVLLHVRSAGKYVGSAALSLGGEGGGAAECLAKDIADVTFPASPWLTASSDGVLDCVVGQVGASAVVVRKTFPDEQLPAPVV